MTDGTMGRFWERPAARFCAALLAALILASIVGPILSPYGRDEQKLENQNRPPSLDHPFGTDTKGRDLMTRIFWGGRITFAVGVFAVLLSLSIGLWYGTVAGYIGGGLETVMMRCVDTLYGLPTIGYVILVISVFEGYGVSIPFFRSHPLEWNIVLMALALGSISWLTLSRIVRGMVLSVKEREFVAAARAMGIGRGRIMFRHIVPNIVGPVIVYTTLSMPAIMLSEALISFLGLGIKPPEPSWGILIADGAQALIPGTIYWWMILFPALFLGVTLLALNIIGDCMRDALTTNQTSQGAK
ncbi:MAG: hypothetical protein A2Z34_08685 [Planctomycetes bacterium RBG_16_59_8]|nr:MAG: hypothetical protein A2Z34_08685 [Planctomycetes bacterium RBG_16_59_8]